MDCKQQAKNIVELPLLSSDSVLAFPKTTSPNAAVVDRASELINVGVQIAYALATEENIQATNDPTRIARRKRSIWPH